LLFYVSYLFNTTTLLANVSLAQIWIINQ